MGTLSVIYLKAPSSQPISPTEVADCLREVACPFDVRFCSEFEWVQLDCGGVEMVEPSISRIAELFPDRELLGIGVQTVSDTVIFEVWRAGAFVRRLKSGWMEQYAWDEIEGEPQAWEEQLFAGQVMEVGEEGSGSSDVMKLGELLQLPGFSDHQWDTELSPVENPADIDMSWFGMEE